MNATTERRAVAACPATAGHVHLFAKGACVSCGITREQRTTVTGWGTWDRKARRWVHGVAA